MFTGGYSAKFKEFQAEELEQQRVKYQQELSYRRERAKQLSEETNRRRRALEQKKKQQAIEEEKRREDTLAKRRKTQETATKKFQRDTVSRPKRSTPAGSEFGSEFGTSATTVHSDSRLNNYQESDSHQYSQLQAPDTLEYALELVHGLSSNGGTPSGLQPTHYNTWIDSGMRTFEHDDLGEVMNGAGPSEDGMGDGDQDHSSGGTLPEQSQSGIVHYEQERLREELTNKSKLSYLEDVDYSERTQGALPSTMEYESPNSSVSNNDSLEEPKIIEVVSEMVASSPGILTREKSASRHKRKVTFNDSIEFDDGLTGQLEILEKNSNKTFGLGNYSLQYYSNITCTPVSSVAAQAAQPQIVSNYTITNTTGRLSSSGIHAARTTGVTAPSHSVQEPSKASGIGVSLAVKSAPMHAKEGTKPSTQVAAPVKKATPVKPKDPSPALEISKPATAADSKQSPSGLLSVRDSLEVTKTRHSPDNADVSINQPQEELNKENRQVPPYDLKAGDQSSREYDLKVSDTLKWVLDQNNLGDSPTSAPVQPRGRYDQGFQPGYLYDSLNDDQVDNQETNVGVVNQYQHPSTTTNQQPPTMATQYQHQTSATARDKHSDTEHFNRTHQDEDHDVMDSLDVRDSLDAKDPNPPQEVKNGAYTQQTSQVAATAGPVPTTYLSSAYSTQASYPYTPYLYEQQVRNGSPIAPSGGVYDPAQVPTRTHATSGAVTYYQSTTQASATAEHPQDAAESSVSSFPYGEDHRVPGTSGQGNGPSIPPPGTYPPPAGTHPQPPGTFTPPPGTYVPPTKPGYYASTIPVNDKPVSNKPPIKRGTPNSAKKPTPRQRIQKANARGKAEESKKTEPKGEFAKRNAANRAKSSSLNDLSRLQPEKLAKGFGKSKESPRNFSPVTQSPNPAVVARKPRAKSAPSNRPHVAPAPNHRRPESATCKTSTGPVRARTNSANLIVGNQPMESKHQRSNSVQYKVEAEAGGTVTKPVIQATTKHVISPQAKLGNLNVNTFTTEIQSEQSKGNGSSASKQTVPEESNDSRRKVKKNVSSREVQNMLDESTQQRKKAVKFHENGHDADTSSGGDDDDFLMNIKRSMDELSFYSKYKKDKPKTHEKIEPANEFDAGTFTLTSYFQPNSNEKATTEKMTPDPTQRNMTDKPPHAPGFAANSTRKVHRPASPSLAYRNNLANRIATRKAQRDKQVNQDKQQTDPEVQEKSPPIRPPLHPATPNNIPLDKTPTDDEINKLWEKVRTCLDHKEQPHTAGSDSCINTTHHYRTGSGPAHQQNSANGNVHVPYSPMRTSNHGFPLRRYSSYEGLRRHGSSDNIQTTRKPSTLLQSRALRSSSASSQGRPPLPRQKFQPFTPSPSGDGPMASMSIYHRKGKLSNSEMKAVMAASEKMKSEYGQPVQHYYLPAHLDRKGPSALSMEEQRLMESLERLNERLRAQEAKQNNGSTSHASKVASNAPGMHHTRSASARGYQAYHHTNQYYSPAPPHR